jgi:hypothetical protein
MGKVGRKSSISPGDITRLEKCFNLGMSVTSACYEVKVSRDAYYRRLKEDEEFRDSMEYAKDFVMRKAKQNVAVAIVNDGNIELSKWWLERKDPEFRLGTRDVVEEEPVDKPMDEKMTLDILARIKEGQEARENYHKMVRRTWEEETQKARDIQAKYATQ